jgi:hypothetical protein
MRIVDPRDWMALPVETREYWIVWYNTRMEQMRREQEKYG